MDMDMPYGTGASPGVRTGGGGHSLTRMIPLGGVSTAVPLAGRRFSLSSVAHAKHYPIFYLPLHLSLSACRVLASADLSSQEQARCFQIRIIISPGTETMHVCACIQNRVAMPTAPSCHLPIALASPTNSTLSPDLCPPSSTSLLRGPSRHRSAFQHGLHHQGSGAAAGEIANCGCAAWLIDRALALGLAGTANPLASFDGGSDRTVPASPR
ncbi:hypothetical protein BT67DRAFT_439984 [Trichocladium antarcticum]|uniref:Uncharacterized protein n=1 Tax=Trichocladium antarcticum TaxID=1450529 RepID=A0AAN6UQS5_9PEZI|nr:hypothetical protein BT67DRAFT_439984 [Trichocladium antarcticum]